MATVDSIPDRLSLTVTQDVTLEGKKQPPTVTLNGVRLERHLLADGLKVEYVEGLTTPIVTLKFCPGTVDVNLDVEVLEQLLNQARVIEGQQ